ncbi:mediator of RNA polymerase II transcription subunit 26-like [Planococcus citri]|uniref:mediator of RNA polymerase II transcription subunit 26-like n=1 Tax=Planococcus citri TaxID=170843 RepID=UPI0031F952CB
MSAISVSWLNVSWGAVYIETNYGLMQHSPKEITNKLLGALDSEYNVVDMPTVFEVVAVLEKTPITLEILETTRLGKLINECRRKTNNEALAKRAKLLVRQWRDMINENSSSQSASANRALSPAITPNVIAPASTLSSYSSSSSSSASLAVPQHNGTNAIRSSLHRSAERIGTPSISPALSVGRNDGIVSPASSLSPGGRDPKVESVPKTHVANKRLRKAASPDIGEPPAKASKANGAMFVDKPRDISLPPSPVVVAAAVAAESEPATTEDDEYSRLRDQPSTVMMADDDAPSIDGHPSTVVTESVPQPDPALPKKRSRKKANKKRVTEDDLLKEKLVAMSKTARVKTTEELVAGLNSRTEASTSIMPSLSNNIHSTDGDPTSSNFAGSGIASITESAKLEQHLKLDPETRVEREIASITAKLPPLNINEISWSSPEPSPPSTPKPITDEDVDRYLQQQWDGVNGCMTHSPFTRIPAADGTAESSDNQNSEFREWHEMVARRTLNDDLIHILPYSIVD